MQYMHRRLQRSVTERRRLASGLPSASRSACDRECVRASQFEPTASKVFPPNDTHESQRAARVLPVAAFLAYGESGVRSEEHTSELQSPDHLVCRLLLEKKKTLCTQLQSSSRAPGR